MRTSNRLHHHTANMVALETELNQVLIELSKEGSQYPDADEIIKDLTEISESQLQTLQQRLESIAGETSGSFISLPKSNSNSDDFPVSTALQNAIAFLNHIIVGYAMLRTIALRYRDSSLIGEVNTGDIAEQHTSNYINIVHRMNKIIHNVVLWEMDKNSETCQCTCPSCGLGICMCAQGPRRTLSDSWLEPGPISTDTDVFLHPPRHDSAALNAGLNHGDTIVSADGHQLESHFTLQGIVGGHHSGEEIILGVKRKSGEYEDVTVMRP